MFRLLVDKSIEKGMISARGDSRRAIEAVLSNLPE
jgi:hypothetical protein